MPVQTYFHIMLSLSAHTQILKHSSYSYLTIRIMMLLMDRLSITQHIHKTQNKYESRTDTKILTRMLCV